MRTSAVKVVIKALEGLILEVETHKKEAVARGDWADALKGEAYGNGLYVALIMVKATEKERSHE